MENMLILSRESLICSICDDLLENPYECKSCNNLFCEECINSYISTKDKYRRLYFCPLCRTKKNNFCESTKIKELLENFKNSGKKLCVKCKSILSQDKINSHKNNCWHKCMICHQIFPNATKFLEHYSNNENHELNKIISKFNRKANLKKIAQNEGESKGFGKIKREKFVNNLKKKDHKEENNFVLINRNGYNSKYNLFFCGENNGINCKCCINKTCSPEGEICPKCMKQNLKYHNLKGYYLINKKGMACKFSNGNFHCYSKFEEKIKDKGGNFFKQEKICGVKYTCEACKNITEIMNYYLPTQIIKKLIERDAQNSQIIKY